MKRRLIGILTAVALAGAGTFVLIAYVGAAEDRALAGERLVEVLVVSEPIRQGMPAADIADSITTKKIAAKMRTDGVVTDLDDIAGKVAAVDLVPGEQLLDSRFVAAGAIQAPGRVSAPEGYHQVTVALDPQRAVGGQIRPGSMVAVLASFDNVGGSAGAEGQPGTPAQETTRMILHKALVTNVQVSSPTPSADDDEEARAPAGSLLVTLGLPPGDVEKVVFAAEHGSVWMSSEPAEAPVDGTSLKTKDLVNQ